MRSTYRDEPCRSALNAVRGMPFRWSLNPYMGCAHRCTFCYVRAFERRADRPSDERYGGSIRVKSNVVQVLDRELSRPRWARELVVIGAATDPYQPIEGQRRLTRGCIEVLAAHSNPFSIITRGPLVVRDRDLLAHAARLARVSVNISVPTLDREISARTEVGVAPPLARLAAVRRLAEAGIRVAVAIAPVIPGLTDSARGIDEVVRAARDHGATSLWASLLYLQAGTREHFLESLHRHWPAEAARLSARYAERVYAPKADSRLLNERVRALRVRHPVQTLGPRIEPPPPEERPVLAEQLGFSFAS